MLNSCVVPSISISSRILSVHAFVGNSNLVYSLIRKRQVFYHLASFPTDQAGIQRILDGLKPFSPGTAKTVLASESFVDESASTRPNLVPAEDSSHLWTTGENDNQRAEDGVDSLKHAADNGDATGQVITSSRLAVLTKTADLHKPPSFPVSKIMYNV